MLAPVTFIAPGLAISASHVFDGAESGDRFRALSLRNDGSIEWWTVEQFSRGIKRREDPLLGPDETQHYDVALVSLRPNFEMPSVFDFTFLEMEVAVPEEGDLLTVVGYRVPEIETVGDRSARGDFQMLSSVGPVLDLHLEGMGWNLPAPCVIADLETPGGLSGGPVFNENGRVIGVLSKSLGDAESGRPSYVSLIWPALTTEVDATWPPDWPDGRASVRTGVMLGRVKATDLHYSKHDGRLSLVLPKPAGPAV